MTDEDWNAGYVRSLGVRLAGDAIEETDQQGRAITDDTLLLLLNAHHEALSFTLPAHKRGVRWQPLLDTSFDQDTAHPVTMLKGGDSYEVPARTVVLLRLGESSRRG